jgi:hypothetical protein
VIFSAGLLLTGVSVRSAKQTGEYNMLSVWLGACLWRAPMYVL